MTQHSLGLHQTTLNLYFQLQYAIVTLNPSVSPSIGKFQPIPWLVAMRVAMIHINWHRNDLCDTQELTSEWYTVYKDCHDAFKNVFRVQSAWMAIVVASSQKTEVDTFSDALKYVLILLLILFSSHDQATLLWSALVVDSHGIYCNCTMVTGGWEDWITYSLPGTASSLVFV